MVTTAGPSELLLRAESGLDLMQWRTPGGIETHEVRRHLMELPIVEGDPIRVGGQWQNRPNQHGLYFWHRTGRVNLCDRDLDVVFLVPMWRDVPAVDDDGVAAGPVGL